MVDSLGLLMTVLVTSAAHDDGEVTPMALARLDAVRFPRLMRIWGESKSHNHDLNWWGDWTK